jgi:hypothetical protein
MIIKDVNDSESMDDSMDVNMSAFAKLETKLKAKKLSDSSTINDNTSSISPTVKLSDVLMQRILDRGAPTEPTFDECCGKGCANCVFISYAEELENYENALEWQKHRQSHDDEHRM